MPTECNAALFEFPPVEGRAVVASFDGGAITSDAGAGNTSCAIAESPCAPLVQVRSGSEVYVLGRPSPAQLAKAGTISSEIGPFDVFAARLAVEGEIAAAAAENATPEDLAEMTDAIEGMRLAAQAGRSTKPANQRFHLALAVAAKTVVGAVTVDMEPVAGRFPLSTPGDWVSQIARKAAEEGGLPRRVLRWWSSWMSRGTNCRITQSSSEYREQEKP